MVWDEFKRDSSNQELCWGAAPCQYTARALPGEPREPRRKVGHRAAVGRPPLLDVGEVATFDDAVEPLGATDQQARSTAGQRVGRQLPRRLRTGPPVEQLDVTGRMGQQQLDGLRLGRIVVGIAAEAPEACLTQARFLIRAGVVEAPGPGLPIQVVTAVVRD